MERKADTVGRGAGERAVVSPDWRLGRFPNLMPRRIQEILLVSSAYDSFILEEDGLLTELIFSEYTDLGLTHAPRVTHVTEAEEALDTLRGGSFDLVITMLRMTLAELREFGQAVRQLNAELPVVLLVASELELARLPTQTGELNLDSVYVWQGDAKVFLAIIKVLEDRWNAVHDARLGGVGVIILVEDSRRFRSSLLPIMYSELVKQARAVMAEGLNRMHRLIRMRARPKILVAESFEAGVELLEQHRDHVFGVIADVRFPRRGKLDPRAGIDFIGRVKADLPDIPTLLQSSDRRNRSLAESIGADFLHKRSTTLLHDVRQFMLNNFGFGDFVFRMPDGQEIARASDLRSMARILRKVAPESLDYHARRNHFSNWLRARTEFVLARRLRPRTVSEFRDLESLRRFLTAAFTQALRQSRRGVIEDFERETFDSASRFARIGGGSLGGKARGLAFFDALLARHPLDREFPVARVYVPRSLVIETDVLDAFLENNRLRSLALYEAENEWIKQAFLKAELPDRVIGDLRTYLEMMRQPLAVRSSSLLEDSHYHPFAGVYETFMIPNNHEDPRVRLEHLCDAIKLVFASTFFDEARRYLRATPYRIEEQSMAVLVQEIVGSRHERYFYPNFAGVVRSYNFYPFGTAKPEDGVACVALGLGKQVVEGGAALRFSPAHPQASPQLSTGKQFLNQSQREFYAVDLGRPESGPHDQSETVARLELEDAERQGTLAAVGSVWSDENNAFYDGIQRAGVRVVTFAHVLKSDLFPLAAILRRLLKIGREGMSGPVEIEFAVNLESEPKEFAVLQVRPYTAGGYYDPVELDELPAEALLCESSQAMGHGVIGGIRDVVYIKPQTFDAANTLDIAREVAAMNEALRAQDRHCLLIGPGRWGSSNRWLGVPVNWGQISTARVVVETTLENFAVDSSQGSHFFHNLVSFGVAYLTVNPRTGRGAIDWSWLESRRAVAESDFVRHVRLAEPLEARVDGRSSRAVVLKRARRSTPR